MNLLDKLNFLMKKYGLNKSTLSKQSDIPYTTIDSLYKKGYSNAKLSTLIALSDFFNVTLDYLVKDEITNPKSGIVDDVAQTMVVIEEQMDKLFPSRISDKEKKVISAYRKADARTKEIVDLALDIASKPMLEAAHERTDKNVSQNEIDHDNALIEQMNVQ